MRAGEIVVSIYIVSDCGGGTTDATVLLVKQTGSTSNGKRDTVSIRVIGLAGDNSLGGTDFTIVVHFWIDDEFSAAGVAPLSHTETRQLAEDIKKRLCDTSKDVTYKHASGKLFVFKFSQYVHKTRELRARVGAVANAAVQDARKRWSRYMKELTMTLMVVGGAHQDPVLIQEMKASFKAQFTEHGCNMVSVVESQDWMMRLFHRVVFATLMCSNVLSNFETHVALLTCTCTYFDQPPVSEQ